ncbi:unnamed protein product [Prorocentrum cordatum]|uniref:Uncharacterized protein n=1 Tax=Prorocentrum cordatum TaxID=2364126 RepID=A0ABN9RAS5_9DINO|nr:unnamed protein product [Polarella glacialis]
MLPSLGSLQRERALLTEVLRSSPASSPAPSPASRPRPAPVPPKAEPAGAAAGRSLSRWSRGDGLQHLPRELLADIAENFLESPVWHLCQLGAAAPRLGQVFMDEEVDTDTSA